jgi:hypothetical protein
MTAACNAPNKTTAIDVSSTIALGGNWSFDGWWDGDHP